MSGYRQDRQLPGTARHVRRDDVHNDPGNPMKPLTRSVTGTGPRRRVLEQSPVTAFMREIGLGQYAQALRNHGFEDVETLMGMREEHMRELGMPAGHIVKLKRHLREFDTEQILATASPSRTRSNIARAPKLESSGTAMTAVQLSWQRMKDMGLDVAGGLFYKKFLDLDPSAAALFPLKVRLRYQNWDTNHPETDDLSDSPALQRLWGRFIEVIGSAVAGLQDTAKMVPMLQQLGMRHVGYGLKVEYFDLAGAVLLDVLAEWLGDAFTREVENAWVMVSGFVIATMSAGFTAAAAEIKAREGHLGLEPPTPCSTDGGDGSIKIPIDRTSEAGSARVGSSVDFGIHTAPSPAASLHDVGSVHSDHYSAEAKKVDLSQNYPPRLKKLVDGSAGGQYGIEWILSPQCGRLVHNSHYNPQWRLQSLGPKGDFSTRSVTYTFMPGQGAVGECYAKKAPIFLQDVARLNRHLSTPFQRADLAKEFGVNSIMFVPCPDGVLEIGSTEKFTSAADFLPADLLAESS